MDITLCNNLSENNIINKTILDKQIIYGAKINLNCRGSPYP